MKRTGPSDGNLLATIQKLHKLGNQHDAPIWKRIASDLEKPTRKRTAVNVYKIAQHTKDSEAVIIPGKVLGTGELQHRVVVGAWNFSEGAREKITKAKGQCLSIEELMEKNPKGQNIRILA